MNNRQSGCSYQGTEPAVKNLVAHAKLTATPRIVTQVETAASALVAEHSNPRQSGEGIAGELRRERIGRREESRTGQWLKIFRRCQIAGAKQQIVSPLSAVVRDIHERHPRARRKIERRHSGPIDVHSEVDKWRTVRFFVRSHTQGWNTVLREPFVAEPVKLPLSGNARQL